jgi:isocitrate dehydrogenase
MNSCDGAPQFARISPPRDGTPCAIRQGRLVAPDNPVICYIDGDGIGSDIGPAARSVIDAAVHATWPGTRRISWFRLYAGTDALPLYQERLPHDTLDAIRQYRLCLKGPLATPVGSGFRSLNVAIRQQLHLYASVRPFTYIPGIPSPVKHPERVDMILFRENTEDVYAGIEWPADSQPSRDIIDFIARTAGVSLPREAGIGIKIISRDATRNLVRMTLDYALRHQRRSVTLVTKGNIMKCTEGAFRQWAYEVAREEYGDTIVTEAECRDAPGNLPPSGKLLLQDRLADDMLQQVLLYPERYDVIAAPNLNGDYLSDAIAAQVGGIATAPGANIGSQVGVFEAAHGTAPSVAGMNVANPTGLILSGALMLEYMGWETAACAIRKAVAATIGSGQMTADLAARSDGITPLSTTDYVHALREKLYACVA